MSSPANPSLAKSLKRLYSKGSRRSAPLALPPPPPPKDPAAPEERPLESYRNDPVGFITEVLGVTLTPDQMAIARKLPGRVKVNAAHSVGKTHLAACLALWWFYTRPKSVVISTAPTEKDVVDLLWTEIRIIHAGAKRALADFFVGPKAPELFENEEHWAKGYTARDAVSFQGRHRESMFFIFDECEGVASHFWDVTQTSYKPGLDHAWLAIGNPVTTSSQSYVEDRALRPDGTPKWDLTCLSALSHPNIVAELAGLPTPVPNAVSVQQVDQWVQDWCEPVVPDEKLPDDIEWRPGSGNWFRPGPQMKARGLGIRPVDGVDTVWGARAWREAIYPRWTPQRCWELNHKITIGCDVASYGCFDDQTEILTDEGWKPFAALTGGESVLSWLKGAAVWAPITKVHQYPFDGELNLYDGGKVNFCVTDNHKFLARSRNRFEGRPHLDEYRNLPEYFSVVRTNTWDGVEVPSQVFTSHTPMPNGGERVYEWAFSGDDWCEFLGWFISEGNCYFDKDRAAYERVLIAQISDPAKVAAIRTLLTRMGLAFSYHGRQFALSVRPIAEYLVDACGHGAHNKRIPACIKNATPRQIDLFLTAFCSGDGTFRNGKRLSYMTSSPQLADDLQEMLAKIGRAGKLKKKESAGSLMVIEGRTVRRRHDVYILNERSRSVDSDVHKNDAVKVPYKGFVYCVSTPNRTICVRRNGCVMWSGNSDDTCFHVRTGPLSVHHERHNGWGPQRIADRLHELTVQWAAWYNGLESGDGRGRPRLLASEVAVTIELDGPGAAVLDLCNGRGAWVGVKVAEASEVLDGMGVERYANVRAQMWFEGRDKALAGRMDLHLLPKDALARLENQLLTPAYKILPAGTQAVEAKDDIKKRLKRSPDDADALLVSYLECPSYAPTVLFKNGG